MGIGAPGLTPDHPETLRQRRQFVKIEVEKECQNNLAMPVVTLVTTADFVTLLFENPGVLLQPPVNQL